MENMWCDCTCVCMLYVCVCAHAQVGVCLRADIGGLFFVTLSLIHRGRLSHLNPELIYTACITSRFAMGIYYPHLLSAGITGWVPGGNYTHLAGYLNCGPHSPGSTHLPTELSLWLSFTVSKNHGHSLGPPDVLRCICDVDWENSHTHCFMYLSILQGEHYSNIPWVEFSRIQYTTPPAKQDAPSEKVKGRGEKKVALVPPLWSRRGKRCWILWQKV